MNNNIFVTKKVIAFDHIIVRAARGGDNPSLIITITKEIAKKANIKIGDRLSILTDGEKIVLKKEEIPEM